MQTVEFNPETHEYYVAGERKDSVTKILSCEGFINAQWYSEYGRDRGSAVHLACHLDDTDDLIEESVDPAIAGYLAAWRKFKAETGCLINESEIPQYNPTFEYCGTPDRDALLFGKLSVIDIKTGQPEPWHPFQTAAYALFKASPRKRYSVQLFEDGKYKLHEHKDRADYDYWRCIVTVHNLKRRLI